MKFGLRRQRLRPGHSRTSSSGPPAATAATSMLEEAYVTPQARTSAPGLRRQGRPVQGRRRSTRSSPAPSASSPSTARCSTSSLGGGETDYIQGVGLIWDDGADGLPLRAEVGYTDGPNTDNTNFIDGGGSAHLRRRQPRLRRLRPRRIPRLRRLEAVRRLHRHGQHPGPARLRRRRQSTPRPATTTRCFHTVDAQYEIRPARPVRRLRTASTPTGTRHRRRRRSDGDDRYDWGFLVQAGYMLDRQWEVFGRYDYVALDDGTAADRRRRRASTRSPPA